MLVVLVFAVPLEDEASSFVSFLQQLENLCYQLLLNFHFIRIHYKNRIVPKTSKSTITIERTIITTVEVLTVF